MISEIMPVNDFDMFEWICVKLEIHLTYQPKCKSVFRQYLTDPDEYIDTQVGLFIIYQKRDQENCAKLKYSGYE